MSGKILIIDPIVTNRVVLKAQLIAEYFSVDLASDLASARLKVGPNLPDILLFNYDSEHTNGFASIKEIRGDARLSHLPIVILCSTVEDIFWANSYRLGVEEVLPTLPDSKLLTTRLAQMIRRKEIIEGQRMRQKTYADMGFSEDRVCFPPQFPPALNVDCAQALRVMTQAAAGGLNSLLNASFPNIQFSNKPLEKPVIQIIDEAQLGREQALQFLCSAQQERTKAKGAPKLLYVSNTPHIESCRRILELGADDFIVAPFCDAELALRMRRLAWLHQLQTEAACKVDDRLRLAMQDPMTGLHNRRYALQYLENISNKRGATQQSLAVMMLDLDNFKLINDGFGHQTGDAVIVETAQRLKHNLRSADLVARVGGEEFLVVLCDTPIQQASIIAKRMCRQVNTHPFQPDKNQQPFDVSISIGVAFATSNCFTPAQLIDHADRALYQSKGQGRNQVTVLPVAA